MKLDLLIKNGVVYDGGKTPPFSADIGISGGKITFVGEFPGEDPDLTINARGLAVSPGFIDTHAHSDFTLVADPRAEGKVCQGITTEINGNCGMSAAPLSGMTRERREGDLVELGIRERWTTLKEYFILLESRGIGLNIAVLAGHGNIRGSVMGYGDGPPSGREMLDMSGLLKEATDQGAIGLSTGLIYPPGVYSDTGELVELSKILKEKGLIYTSHMRSEGDGLLEAVGEVIEIGRKTGVKVHISHIKTAGEVNWYKAGRVCAMLEEARLSGTALTCDRYPYIASSTDLDAILPPWVYAGGSEEEMKRLKDNATRANIVKELTGQVLSGEYWKRVTISSVVSKANKWMEGKTLADISGKIGLDETDLLFRLLVGENLRVGAIFRSMSEDNLRKFLSLPFCMIGSDSSARCFDGPTMTGKPHPRTFGTFPRFFGRYVREERLMELSEAVYRATMLPALTFGLAGRGRVAEGMWADVTVFDPEKVLDAASFDEPFRRPEGIRYVLVNGVPALWDGTVTGKLAGRVLRFRDRNK
ncbi:MAG: D-aminoacylase [Candidatus Sulfobium sp.]|jgi:N-acyl-D-amino-acid deacylase